MFSASGTGTGGNGLNGFRCIRVLINPGSNTPTRGKRSPMYCAIFGGGGGCFGEKISRMSGCCGIFKYMKKLGVVCLRLRAECGVFGRKQGSSIV